MSIRKTNNQTSLQTINKMNKYLKIKLEREIREKYTKAWEKDQKISLERELNTKYKERIKKERNWIKNEYNDYYKKKYSIKNLHLKDRLNRSITINDMLKEKHDGNREIWMTKYTQEIKLLMDKIRERERKSYGLLDKDERFFPYPI